MPGHSQPALAVYDELGDTLMVIKMQLKSVLQAEVRHWSLPWRCCESSGNPAH
jgi:hypothetical protein